MVNHKDMASDCRRIAKELESGDPDVVVSLSFIKWFNKEIRKDVKALEAFNTEVNKHLSGCRAEYRTVGYGHGWFLRFVLHPL